MSGIWQATQAHATPLHLRTMRRDRKIIAASVWAVPVAARIACSASVGPLLNGRLAACAAAVTPAACASGPCRQLAVGGWQNQCNHNAVCYTFRCGSRWHVLLQRHRSMRLWALSAGSVQYSQCQDTERSCELNACAAAATAAACASGPCRQDQRSQHGHTVWCSELNALGCCSGCCCRRLCTLSVGRKQSALAGSSQHKQMPLLLMHAGPTRVHTGAESIELLLCLAWVCMVDGVTRCAGGLRLACAAAAAPVYIVHHVLQQRQCALSYRLKRAGTVSVLWACRKTGNALVLAATAHI